MLERLRYTLLGDGPSDRVLTYPIDWLLDRIGTRPSFIGTWADQRDLGNVGHSVGNRVLQSLKIFPCDLLIVHRDAEREQQAKRVLEIMEAIGEIVEPPVVCLVPVRMTEAWLMIDEQSLRRVAGRPGGTRALDWPPLNQLESLANPKARLQQLFEQASEFSGRRLKRLKSQSFVFELAEQIDDWSPLENLPAFRAFRADLEATLDQKGWR
jgi:Domain of unknown function (DUF4276)